MVVSSMKENKAREVGMGKRCLESRQINFLNNIVRKCLTEMTSEQRQTMVRDQTIRYLGEEPFS